ncbi:MAG: metal ABC transporter substrate-binding protein, partial [Candidatus Glassbacteria bacterium]
FAATGGKIKVVASYADYAAIAREIGGERVVTDYMSYGDMDPHFVQPKPSLVKKLSDADLWVETGLDLELWATTLLDKAHNSKIMDGTPGYVSVCTGIDLLEKPTTALSRTEGDIHIYGNPHIHTGPQNWGKIAENILIGLVRVDPAGEQYYRENYAKYSDRVDRALFGAELVRLIGGKLLEDMLRSGTFFQFLEKDYQGAPLEHKLGGWLKEALPLRGLKIISYHKSWPYFVSCFGLEEVGYIEPKPGIPPSARHVGDIIDLIQNQKIRILTVATYFEKNNPHLIEQRTGIKAVYLPLHCGGSPELPDEFALMSYWIQSLLSALGQ